MEEKLIINGIEYIRADRKDTTCILIEMLKDRLFNELNSGDIDAVYPDEIIRGDKIAFDKMRLYSMLETM